MARIRSIKPEFFTSEQLAECSTNARLLFIGMWCFCDDNGVHPAQPMTLKMQVFPGDSFTKEQINGMVDELKSAGLLCEYDIDGKAYWRVTGWKKHQKIDRPSYKYPLPESDEPSTSHRRTLDDGHPPESKGVEGKGKESSNPPLPPLPVDKAGNGVHNSGQGGSGNDYFAVHAACCSLLGVPKLSLEDQELLSAWCIRYDMEGYALPAMRKSVDRYMNKHGGKRPGSLLYFRDMLAENEPVSDLSKTLASTLRVPS